MSTFKTMTSGLLMTLALLVPGVASADTVTIDTAASEQSFQVQEGPYQAALSEMQRDYPELYATLTPQQIQAVLMQDMLRTRHHYSDAEMKKITGFTWTNGKMTPTSQEIQMGLASAWAHSLH